MEVGDYRFRLASEADAAGILAIYAPVVRDTAISWEYEAPTLEEMRTRIRDKIGHGYPWIVAETVPESGATAGEDAGRGSGQIAGYAYAGRWRDRQAYDWSCETSVYVHPGFFRRGLGRALYASLFRVLAQQGFEYAVAGIALPNPGSVALHEAVGMTPAGTNRHAGFKSGSWWDIAFYERRLGTAAIPSPLIPVLELAAGPEWMELLGGL